jgi:hypothetical protein
MLSCECILAAALLTSSPDAPLPAEAEAWIEVCSPQLVALALDAQLADRREQAEFFRYPHETITHLRKLQDRFENLAFAPLVEESERFPDWRAIDGFLAFNRAYARDLQTRLALDTVHAEHLRQARAENDYLHRVWSTLRDARPLYNVCYRRQALLRVRELIGDEAFYSGRMPPYVPVWRFPVAP